VYKLNHCGPVMLAAGELSVCADCIK